MIWCLKWAISINIVPFDVLGYGFCLKEPNNQHLDQWNANKISLDHNVLKRRSTQILASLEMVNAHMRRSTNFSHCLSKSIQRRNSLVIHDMR